MNQLQNYFLRVCVESMVFVYVTTLRECEGFLIWPGVAYSETPKYKRHAMSQIFQNKTKINQLEYFLCHLYVNPCHSRYFGRDHLRFNMGIISGAGSFAVQFGDHLRTRADPPREFLYLELGSHVCLG